MVIVVIPVVLEVVEHILLVKILVKVIVFIKDAVLIVVVIVRVGVVEEIGELNVEKERGPFGSSLKFNGMQRMDQQM